MSEEKKNLLIGITGAISAINIHQYLVELKRSLNCNIKIIMTKNAHNIINYSTILNFCDGVYTELFNNEVNALHVSLADWADEFIIMPATANNLYKIANGVGDDLLSASILNYDNQLVIVPSMNSKMWNSKGVKRNVSIIEQDGHYVIKIPAYGYKVSSGKEEYSEVSLPSVRDFINLMKDRLMITT